jgi:hypothetical protein
MKNNSDEIMNNSSSALNGISWFFGILFLAIGFINSFWGNDPEFGVFILLLSLVFVPPLTALFKAKTGFGIPGYFKIGLGIFILWAALGVGELFAKIDLMTSSL